MPNRLIDETSPYLLQHADNPVEWYPWGEEAFQKAQREHKPVFLSIGYSSCHWCHVMERESFENDQIAALLNEHFIAVKVDREERPDIDKHYQEIYRKMNNAPGGWPLSIFMSEERIPFYAGTYLPPEPRYGLPSFKTLLETIIDKYRNDKPTLIREGQAVLQALTPDRSTIQATKLDTSIVARIKNHAETLFDYRYGGFSKAPKFPQTSLVHLLLDHHQLTGDDATLKMAEKQLDEMAKGGLYDLIDGGFCRYSTDDAWLVPHFEKMTYDNALLAALYLRAYALTQKARYRDIAFDTLDFMLEKMYEKGLFYSASDADSEGIEGKYFTFDYIEAKTAMLEAGIPKSDIDRLLDALHITPEGNFEGSNIVRIDDPETAASIPRYDEAIAVLRNLRAERPYPFIDKKIITSWNAMAVRALFIAARYAPERYASAARESLDTLLNTLYVHGRLFHTTIIGHEPKIHAYLEDYAYLAEALFEAYQTTLDETHLILAQKLVNQAIERFYDKGFWKFSRGEFDVEEEAYDTSYPSSLSTMVHVLYDTASLIDPVYKKFVFKTLEVHSYDLMRQPLSYPKLASALLRYLFDDIVIKAKEEALKTRIKEKENLPYPFVRFRSDTNEGYMLCNTAACFGHLATFEEVRDYLLQRRGDKPEA
jgi:uncharacterized protein YyaL (SSP411 family)